MTQPRDYREQTAEAKTWRRAHTVQIHNPVPGQGSVPLISFHEEDAIQVGGKVITTPAYDAGPGGLRALFQADGVYPLVNPVTGESLGASMTHQELYVALHSLYMHLAGLRDNPPVVEPEPEPETPAEGE